METLTKLCRRCGKQFSKSPKSTYERWTRRFCCSKECGDKSKKTPWLVKYQIKKGEVRGAKTLFRKGQHLMENNNKWKGDDASYYAKHIWVGNNFGRPNFCEHCKSKDEKMYHWANISGEYKRIREDWKRLCVSCHKKYDLS